jgi:hypothetical protein
LQGAQTTIQKVPQQLYSAVAKQLGNAKADVATQGFTMPWSSVDMTNQLTGNALQMVANASPAMAQVLGMQPQPYDGLLSITSPPVPSYGGDMTPTYATAQNVVGGGIDESGGIPVVLGGAVVPGGTGMAPGGTAGGVPLVGGVPLGAESGPTATFQTAPAICCPAPTNVTVNVPPITVPPYSAPPPSSCPTAPGSVPVAYVTEPAPVVNVQLLAAGAPGAAAPVSGGQQAVPVAAPLLWPDATKLGAISGPDGVNWNDPKVCPIVDRVVKEVVGKPVAQAQPGPQTTRAMDEWIANQLPFGSDAFRWSVSKGEEFWGKGPYDWMRRQYDSVVENKNKTLNSMLDTTTAMWATTILSPTSTPNPTAAVYYGGRLALATRAERATGAPVTYLYQSDQYLFQFANPQFLPNQIRIDSAYLAATIDDATWICWTRANGNLPDPARRVMLADQVRPGVRELIDLYRRGNLALPDLFARCRQQGVLDPNYVREYMRITQALPGISDLVRFMVRDAADENVAKRFNYDKDFNQKFAGPMKAWADALGIDEQYFRFAWRSHWNIPSYTQLTEMLSRLRPDRLEVTEWNNAFGPGVTVPADTVVPPKPQSVTVDDVREALEVDDMAPGWIDRMISIAYAPINRTDSVRAFMIGSFSADQLYDAFRNVKYSDRDAKLLVKFYTQQRSRQQRQLAGTWTTRKIIRYFKAGTISETQATQLLKDILPSPAAIQSLIDQATLEMNADTKALQFKSIKRQFMLGEFNEAQMRSALIDLGVDLKQLTRFTMNWTIERDGRLKQPTVSMISAWLRKGIIGVEEAENRFVNLGYKKVDADRIIAAALKFEYGEDVPSAEELSGVITDVIKNQKAAKKTGDGKLTRRLRQIVGEAKRIMVEVNRRRADAGEQLLPQVVLP